MSAGFVKSLEEEGSGIRGSELAVGNADRWLQRNRRREWRGFVLGCWLLRGRKRNKIRRHLLCINGPGSCNLLGVMSSWRSGFSKVVHTVLTLHSWRKVLSSFQSFLDRYGTHRLTRVRQGEGDFQSER